MLMDMCFFFFLFSLIHVFYQNKVFLSLLLAFELLTVSVFCGGVYLGGVCWSAVSFHVCLLVLCLAVCESVMGLAVLISCSRHIGKSGVVSFSCLKF